MDGVGEGLTGWCVCNNCNEKSTEWSEVGLGRKDRFYFFDNKDNGPVELESCLLWVIEEKLIPQPVSALARCYGPIIQGQSSSSTLTRSELVEIKIR